MGFLGVYGHVNVDHILLVAQLPGAERTVPVERSLVRLGGTGGNIARAAAAMGVSTSLAACVGDDFPEWYRRSLAESGIELTDLKPVAGATPRVWILSVPGGPQSTVIDQGVMGDGLARPKLDFAWLNSDWVHFTTGNPVEWLEAARQAAQAGKNIVFDPAQELAYRYPSRLFEEFLNLSDVFICNEHELARALDLLSYGDARQLIDHADHLVVTQGSRGARFLTRKMDVTVPACPLRMEGPAETTGAGDVFRAGLYAALMRRQEWPDALRSAAAASSLFLEQRGERFPTWDEVRDRRTTWPG